MSISATPNSGKHCVERYYCSSSRIAFISNDVLLGKGMQVPSIDPNDGKILSSIAVKKRPTKITYTIGERLDLDGLVITATDRDDSTTDIDDTAMFSAGTSLSLEDFASIAKYCLTLKNGSSCIALRIGCLIL
jgi:hypothetical protein